MAVTFNRGANTIKMDTVGDTYTVQANEEICIQQVFWTAFSVATDNLLIQLNITGSAGLQDFVAFQAGATTGAQRIPCHDKHLKAGDILKATTLDHGTLLFQLKDL